MTRTRPLPYLTGLAAMATFAALAATGHQATAAPKGTASQPTPTQSCGILAPDASILSTERGRTVNTLFPHEGRVFYGYGDYSANTGSMAEPYGTNVSSFDPVTGEFAVHFPGFKTEEVNTFRAFEGDLFVPNIDPSRGADSTNSFATDATGAWAENSGAQDSIHVYDVAKAGTDLFIAGSSPDPRNSGHGFATIWRSTDNGATWARSYEETEDDATKRTGFERYYWLGTIDGKVYARAALNLYPEHAALRVFDPAAESWSVVPESSEGVRFGENVYDAHDVVSWNNRLWTANGLLHAFDGRTTSTVSASGRTGYSVTMLTVGDDGHLYAAGYDGLVYRVVSESSGATSLTRVGAVSQGASAFTVAAGKLWSAGAYGSSSVCSFPLTTATDGTGKGGPGKKDTTETTPPGKGRKS